MRLDSPALRECGPIEKIGPYKSNSGADADAERAGKNRIRKLFAFTRCAEHSCLQCLRGTLGAQFRLGFCFVDCDGASDPGEGE